MSYEQIDKDAFTLQQRQDDIVCYDNKLMEKYPKTYYIIYKKDEKYLELDKKLKQHPDFSNFMSCSDIAFDSM